MVNVALTTDLAHRLVLAAGIADGVLFNLLYWRAHTRGRRCVWLTLRLGLLKRKHLRCGSRDNDLELGLNRVDRIQTGPLVLILTRQLVDIGTQNLFVIQFLGREVFGHLVR